MFKIEAKQAFLCLSLRFYSHCEGHEPTLLLIRTTDGDVSKEPFLQTQFLIKYPFYPNVTVEILEFMNLVSVLFELIVSPRKFSSRGAGLLFQFCFGTNKCKPINIGAAHLNLNAGMSNLFPFRGPK